MGDSFSYITPFLILILLIGMIIFLTKSVKHFFPQFFIKSSEQIKILESFVLDPHRKVMIINVHDQEYCLLLGQNHNLILDKKPKK